MIWCLEQTINVSIFENEKPFLKPKIDTTKTLFSELGFSEPRFSEIPTRYNEYIITPFFIFYSLSRLNFVNRLYLVNKKGLTTTFTKSSLGCTLPIKTGLVINDYVPLMLFFWIWLLATCHLIVVISGTLVLIRRG